MRRSDGAAARHLEPPTVPAPRREEEEEEEQLPLGDALEDVSWVRREYAFANALASALLAHEPNVVRALLEMPIAGNLPRVVREEAQLFTAISRSSLRAPMQALLHLRRLEALLDDGE